MFTVINGFDYTDYIEFPSISIHSAISDPQPRAGLEVTDIGSQFSFSIGQEVIIFDENATPTYTSSGRAVPTTPSHNVLIGMPNVSPWTAAGALSSLITVAVNPTMTFNNSALGSGSYGQICPAGHVRPGQQYMFSMYMLMTTPLVNANAFLQLDFIDASGNVIGGATTTTIAALGNNQQQQITVVGTAPATATALKASFGGTTTVGGSNSGVVVFGSPQAEPMWFTSLARGVTYPTADNNIAQVGSAQMPDGTFSRQCRVFAGTIDDYVITYDGPNRIWQLSIAGPGALLENGLINAIYTGQYDDQIITSVVSNNFAGQISLAAPNNSSAAPVQRGAYIDSVSYSDNTLREILNGLVDQSGFVYYIDYYYAIRYNTAFYTAALFALTSETPDNASLFNYYDFSLESDGTQLKRRVKVTGGKFIAPAISDTFSGNGSTKVFALSQSPFNVQSVTVGGSAQTTGVAGRDTLGSGGIVALIDKANKTLTFQSAPGSGTNNVICTYTYEAPVATQSVSGSRPAVAPGYAVPNYDSKVNDTNLITLVSATTRGLAELTKYSQPRTIIKLKSDHFAPAGSIIYLTHMLSGIINQPYTVQSIDASYLGNGINEYAYQLGAYQPGLIDHIRNANKALNRSTTTLNITTPQQIDVVASEIIAWRDAISATVQTAYATSVYGTGHYGSCAYGGATGLYGSTAQYGRSTIYG
ncbi:hypothetical protein [Tengunoibacter tsumagoiensis]|uniref:Uncharacterized protein n=1 Tax=Tengunoibacter tsumagoiensis TaxID=2014871 RepID=A0A402A4X6_9CHLR|nr:hypothetical protein [Tengunoibacter tsumagoiensis]GCE14204.1 hypothetical protein KTT_40630 [Tengunoibacter tsumagoiensis]GCE14258.1 hypothetical protein KTT_41170 [Tengunoibacter tsumagoiensis]